MAASPSVAPSSCLEAVTTKESSTVDAIDEKIVAELTRNARVSYAELAGKVLLSRNAVQQRIERLERQGHIAGYTIVRAGDDTGDVVSALVLVYR